MNQRLYRCLDQGFVHRIAQGLSKPRGAFLLLHQVVATPATNEFDPNRPWTISTDLLTRTVRTAQELGMEAVTMDEALRRIQQPRARPFFCLTFDDGYADNAHIAWPLCRQLGVPITVYVTSGFVRRTDDAWWHVLALLFTRRSQLDFQLAGRQHRFACSTLTQKAHAFKACERLWRDTNRTLRREAMTFLTEHGAQKEVEEVRSRFLQPDELREFAREPGVCIGAHSISHSALARIDADDLLTELAQGAIDLQAITGMRPEHLAYPYGGWEEAGTREFEAARALGFRSALTTRHAIVTKQLEQTHQNDPIPDGCFRLPRLALLADDNESSVRCKLTGLTTIADRFRRRKRTLPPLTTGSLGAGERQNARC